MPFPHFPYIPILRWSLLAASSWKCFHSFSIFGSGKLMPYTLWSDSASLLPSQYEAEFLVTWRCKFQNPCWMGSLLSLLLVSQFVFCFLILLNTDNPDYINSCACVFWLYTKFYNLIIISLTFWQPYPSVPHAHRAPVSLLDLISSYILLTIFLFTHFPKASKHLWLTDNAFILPVCLTCGPRHRSMRGPHLYTVVESVFTFSLMIRTCVTIKNVMWEGQAVAVSYLMVCERDEVWKFQGKN